jgi:uncharacterized membrane protein/nitrite reductase/ring-hydroxylating ferredoxin subunit
MRSKASINGHPIHPILVTFPIAFFTGTLVFDILAVVNNNTGFWQTGKYLNIAGIAGGLLAALPGIIDYFFTVPPASSAKKRATIHGLTNVSVVIVFSVAMFLKCKAQISDTLIIAIESVGMIMLCIAGYMGATMVYRNQIGVYNRYADKGIWREAHVKEVNGKIEAALEDELKINQMKLIHADKKRIVVGRSEDGYLAFDDRCTHKGGSLAGGTMICNTVQCPWHGSQFDLQTGRVKAGPATEKINTYRIVESEGKVFIIL